MDSTLYTECENRNWNAVSQILDGERVDLEYTACIDDRTPLIIAVFNGKLDIVKKMLARGADIEDPDIWGQTPLMYTSYDKKGVEIAEELFDNGADIEARDLGGASLLIVTIMSDDLNMIKFFLEQGANIDCVDDHFWSPLMYAAENGVYEIIKELLDQGADRSLVDRNGKTFMDHFKDEDLKTQIDEYIYDTLITIKGADY